MTEPTNEKARAQLRETVIRVMTSPVIIKLLENQLNQKIELGNRNLSGAKSRDKREPKRKEKQDLEDKLSRVFMRRFKRQSDKLMARLPMLAPGHKDYTQLPLDFLFEIDPEEEDIQAEILRLILTGAKGGVELFNEIVLIGLDNTLINSNAAKWALKYVGELIKAIDHTTLTVVKTAVNQFIETPGMTMGDLKNLLPFGEERAQKIATTEVTRAYASGQRLAGEELAKEFPDVEVVKVWFTNNDDLVCKLCGPLDGKKVPIDDKFSNSWDAAGEEQQPPRHVNCRCWMSTSTRINKNG